MQKPTDPSLEDATEADQVVALEEDGDVEKENLEYSGIAGFVESQFRRSKDDRMIDEERWLTAYRNYRGLYSSEVQFTDTEKSKAFVKITKTKVLASYAEIVDVLMADNKFQLDRKKVDKDGDGELSDYEEATGEAAQKAIKMSDGGMACSCGAGEDCGCGMMSEQMPIGASESEVADDISVMISEGEYVLPANVVKWHGIKHIMEMQSQTEMGLMMMHDDGLIQEVDGETESDSEGSENAEVSDESDT